MIKWIKNYQQSTRQTKLFIWMCIIYAILMAASTIYSYARLEKVHEEKPTSR